MLQAKVQGEIDCMYDKFVKMYHAEMATFMKEVKKTPKCQKFLRYTKRPYWDEELSEPWNIFH